MKVRRKLRNHLEIGRRKNWKIENNLSLLEKNGLELNTRFKIFPQDGSM